MHGVGISYPRHISHVDRIHMGDVGHTQGTNTVDDSQHPGSSAALPRFGRPPSQSADPGYAVSTTNLEEAAP